MKLSALLASCTVFVTLLTGCGNNGNSGSSASGGSGGSGSVQIAVIPKGTTHEYWKSIHAGANKAQQEIGKTADGKSIEIIWKGPVTENDSTAQINVVDDMINSNVSGIVLAPNDANALARVVEKASAKNIPVIIIDSDINTDSYKSFVATDNHKGGMMGGDYLAKILGDKGKVIMMRYEEGSASTEKREQGFVDAMKQNHPNVELVSINQYGGATADTAQKAAENLLAAYKNADGSLSIDGIFTPNESTTFGMLRALQEAGAAGKVKFVGFDASEKLVTGLGSGEINALVVQDPVHMGYLGVSTMVDVLNGKTVDKRIDTGVHLATPDNLKSQDIQDLLHPPLDKYLK